MNDELIRTRISFVIDDHLLYIKIEAVVESTDSYGEKSYKSAIIRILPSLNAFSVKGLKLRSVIKEEAEEIKLFLIRIRMLPEDKVYYLKYADFFISNSSF